MLADGVEDCSVVAVGGAEQVLSVDLLSYTGSCSLEVGSKCGSNTE